MYVIIGNRHRCSGRLWCRGRRPVGSDFVAIRLRNLLLEKPRNPFERIDDDSITITSLQTLMRTCPEFARSVTFISSTGLTAAATSEEMNIAPSAFRIASEKASVIRMPSLLMRVRSPGGALMSTPKVAVATRTAFSASSQFLRHPQRVAFTSRSLAVLMPVSVLHPLM